jgi:hypothetical protein
MTERARRMSDLFVVFASEWSHIMDFSDEAKLSLYNHESYGSPLSPNNGFAQGKKMLNLQVNGWKEMLREGTLAKFELYEDPLYPHWWLDSILKDTYKGLTYEDLLDCCKLGHGIRRSS